MSHNRTIEEETEYLLRDMEEGFDEIKENFRKHDFKKVRERFKYMLYHSLPYNIKALKSFDVGHKNGKQ